MEKLKIFMKKALPVALTMIASGGVLATAVLSVRAGSKAHDILKKKESEKGSSLTFTEKMRCTWKIFLAPAGAAAGTIATIATNQVVNAKTIAAVSASYVGIAKAYDQANVKGETPEETEDIREKLASKEHPLDDDEIVTFYECHYGYFESTMKDVFMAELELQKQYQDMLARHSAGKNEGIPYNFFVECLGLEVKVPFDDIGWRVSEHRPWINVVNSLEGSDMNVVVIDFLDEPLPNFEGY